ncbi:MAG: diguanylate cyclase, partial [Gammaproteobacteria bacterium]
MAVGYFMFLKMNASLLQHQQEQFYENSISKIKTFNKHVKNITKNFKTYTQLPSFKSIRFHTLTLNHLAAEEDKRHLELFLFDILKNNNYLLATKFIDNDGIEIIKVDQTAIYSNLDGILKDGDIIHIDELNLKANEYHIETLSNNSRELKNLIWWIPVYVSSTTRLGYLVFKVDPILIKNEISVLADSGLNFILINNEFDNISQRDFQLISEPLPDDINLEDKDWVVSDDLALSGLNWKIHIIGNKKIYNKGITKILSIVNFGLIPASVLILVFLTYLYRKKIESDKHIHHLAYYDSLTGLVNRHQFDNTLNIAVIETQEHNSQHALLYLDLDQFKIVNDTCGHLAGDKLLEQLAAHLKHSVRDSDMLARLGGDEFALLLNLCPENKAINIANKILNSVSEFRFVWKDRSFSIGVSIGVVFINNPHETASNILRKADLSCYMAKELGRNRIHVYTDEDQSLEARHGEMQWVHRIEHALDNNQFFLEAQLIQPLGDNKTSSQHYEVLIRLNENGKVILPDAFIPAAERYGLMPNIDKWVIDNTFSFMKKLLNSPSDKNNNISFSINISGSTLGHKDLFPFIKEKLTSYKIPAASICFEITET